MSDSLNTNQQACRHRAGVFLGKSLLAAALPCLALLSWASLLGSSTQALAQSQSFPSKSIRLVVPFPAGSATDNIARAFAGAVASSIGQNVLVENKAGADGMIAAGEVMRAAPDGYTLLMATNSPMAGAPALRKSPPYDPVTDFTPITDIGRYTFFLVAHPSLPANNLSELIQYAKANPGKLNYATGNTTGIVTIAQLSGLTGIQMVQVPYKGEPQALTDLIAGRVQLMVSAAGVVVPHIKEGRLKAIAVTLPRRSPALPNVPTIAESGVPKFSLISWAALFGPAKMPRDVVDRLNKEFNVAMTKPEVAGPMEKQAFELVGSTPEKLASWVKDQYEVYKNVLKAAGVEPE
jgi:tripartite-type tricarboxylate transporter receptor subunit TctC